jgi:hypothetical protein
VALVGLIAGGGLEIAVFGQGMGLVGFVWKYAA